MLLHLYYTDSVFWVDPGSAAARATIGRINRCDGFMRKAKAVAYVGTAVLVGAMIAFGITSAYELMAVCGGAELLLLGACVGTYRYGKSGAQQGHTRLGHHISDGDAVSTNAAIYRLLQSQLYSGFMLDLEHLLKLLPDTCVPVMRGYVRRNAGAEKSLRGCVSRRDQTGFHDQLAAEAGRVAHVLYDKYREYVGISPEPMTA